MTEQKKPVHTFKDIDNLVSNWSNSMRLVIAVLDFCTSKGYPDYDTAIQVAECIKQLEPWFVQEPTTDADLKTCQESMVFLKTFIVEHGIKTGKLGYMDLYMLKKGMDYLKEAVVSEKPKSVKNTIF